MTKRKYVCEYCGRPTANYDPYDPWLAAALGIDGHSTCDECARKWVDYILWLNEQEGKDYVTCPYCGYEDHDSCELGDRDDDHECPRCGELFSYERFVNVSYTSTKRREDYPGEVPEIRRERKKTDVQK